MATEALQIDALWSGLNDPDTGLSYGGAIVATFAADGSTPKAVWEDKEKTAPTTAGKSQFTLDSNGQAEVFGDGVYVINVYDSTDTGLTSPRSTIDGATYINPEGALVSGIDSFTDLRAGDGGESDGEVTNLLGSETPGDGGGGIFYWDDVSTDADDDIVTIKATPATGRWIRSDSTDIKNIHSGDHSLPNAVDYVSDGSAVRVDGIYDVGDDGVILTDKSLKIFGMQSGADIDRELVGDEIINTGVDTVDSSVITFDGSGSGDFIERAKIEDLIIEHEGATSYAITHTDSIHNWMHNVWIDLNIIGFGGVIFDESGFFASINKSKVKDFTDIGVYITGTGSEHNLIDSQVSSTVAGAIAVLTEQPGTNIVRGEYACSGAGGICIKFNNVNIADRVGGHATSTFFELIPADGYGIVVDGDTHAFTDIDITELRVDLSSNQGSCVLFERAKYCRITDPQVSRYSSGGTLVEWGELSVECVLTCGYIAALAPITVHASATRATKVVTGLIQRILVTNITTDSNLTTILRDGVDALPPGFIPVHNGVAWNYQYSSISGNTAISFTPPSEHGIIRVISNSLGSSQGHIVYDADSTTAVCEVAGVGTDLEATTGPLTGLTGNAGKVTVSAHTDGLIYVENQRSSSTFIILIEAGLF